MSRLQIDNRIVRDSAWIVGILLNSSSTNRNQGEARSAVRTIVISSNGRVCAELDAQAPVRPRPLGCCISARIPCPLRRARRRFGIAPLFAILARIGLKPTSPPVRAWLGTALLAGDAGWLVFIPAEQNRSGELEGRLPLTARLSPRG